LSPKEVNSKELLAGGAFLLTNFALTFLTGMLLARWLGPEGYGDYAVGVALATLLAVPAALGLNRLVNKNLPVYAKQGQWASYRGFVLAGWLCIAAAGVILALLLFVTHEWIYAYFGHDRHALLLTAFFVGPLAGLTMFVNEILAANRHFILASVNRMLIFPGLILASILVLRLSGYPLDPVAAFWCYTGGCFAGLCLAAILGHAKAPRQALAAKPQYQVKAWLVLSLPFMLNALVVIVIRRVGVLMLEAFSSLEGEVGLYAAVALIGSFLTMLIPLSNSYFLPRLSPLLKQNQPRAANRILGKRLGALALICALYLLTVIVGGREILGAFHKDFVAGYGVLLVFSVGVSLNVLLAVAPTLLQYQGQTRQVVKMYGVTALATLGLCAGLAPWLHAMGVAVGSLLPSAVMMFIQARKLAKEHNIVVIGLPGFRGGGVLS
jgi:O-antigen/teichoic acid export membrane protein